MHTTELRNSYLYGTSDTYSAAYRQAREALGVQPVSSSTIARMDVLSHELAAGLRDSSESLRDVRKLCRMAVINAIRVHIGAEIDTIIAELDEIRRSGINSTMLDRAICSAFGARVNLESAPFHETLRHLENARILLDSLTGISLAGEHTPRTSTTPSGMPHSFETLSASVIRAKQQPVN